MSDEAPLWQKEVDRGWQPSLFQLFDEEGETSLRQRFSELTEHYKAHARVWLRLQEAHREKIEQERIQREREHNREELVLQRRATDAAERSAEASERSAEAAQISAAEARKARKIAAAALAVAVLAVVVSVIAVVAGIAWSGNKTPDRLPTASAAHPSNSAKSLK